MSENVQMLFCLMGPTASGKTDLACELASHFPFEIISVDSAMVYREMTIGTAKPTRDILEQFPHHLIDMIDPIDTYSASQFCHDVDKLCKMILKRGKIPLLVGGTMMYFHALQQGLSSLPEADEEVRSQLMHEATIYGWGYMHQMLDAVDPVSAARIHPHDTQRIQRALEVYRLTNQPLSALLHQDKPAPRYQFVNIALCPDARSWLHDRIAQRFDHMLSDGVIDEVKTLLQTWPLTLDHPSMRSVGYRQVFMYLQGDYDETMLREKGIVATRQLAKRQLTWLRHWPKGMSFSAEDPNTFALIRAYIQETLERFK